MGMTIVHYSEIILLTVGKLQWRGRERSPDSEEVSPGRKRNLGATQKREETRRSRKSRFPGMKVCLHVNFLPSVRFGHY